MVLVSSSCSSHREVISKIVFLPTLNRRSHDTSTLTSERQEVEGRYISVCKDGTICFWKNDFTLQKMITVCSNVEAQPCMHAYYIFMHKYTSLIPRFIIILLLCSMKSVCPHLCPILTLPPLPLLSLPPLSLLPGGV